MTLKKNEIITVEIVSLSSDGNGIAKHEGITVFVPYSAVGDTVIVKIAKVQKNYVYAIIQNISKPSKSRVMPECSTYYKCGGCCFAHINYKAELTAKKSFVESAMQRIAKINVPVLDVLPSPQQTRYRNKVQLPTSSDDGKVYSGFFAPRSHRVIPHDDCVLQPKLLNEIAKFCCELFTKYNVSTYDEQTQKGVLRHIYMRHSLKTNNVLLCFIINENSLPHYGKICEQLINKYPQICGIVLNINTKNTNVILGKKNKVLMGSGILQDEICDVSVKLDVMSFYQVNTLGASMLYSKAAQLANINSNDILLDLYCGTGTIGLAMVKNRPCKQLIGVEIIEQAVQSAKLNAENLGINYARFICADAGAATEMLVKEGIKPSIIVLDPPRKGCDEKTLNSVMAMCPKKIIMISCNVATAARDIKYLSENGYTVSVIQPVDLFPKTKHVECIFMLNYNL